MFQLASTLFALLALVSFSIFGSLFAMAAYGDTKITLRWLQNLPQLTVQVVFVFYFPPSQAQLLSVGGSVAMMVKGLSGDVLHSIKVWWDEKETQFNFDEKHKMHRWLSHTPTWARAPNGQAGMDRHGRGSAAELPLAMKDGAPVDADPCVCAGPPLQPCADDVAACGPAVAAGCFVPGRRAYADALAYSYGALSLGETIWCMTVAPFLTFAIFCVPLMNFVTIPLFLGRLSDPQAERAVASATKMSGVSAWTPRSSSQVFPLQTQMVFGGGGGVQQPNAVIVPPS